MPGLAGALQARGHTSTLLLSLLPPPSHPHPPRAQGKAVSDLLSFNRRMLQLASSSKKPSAEVRDARALFPRRVHAADAHPAAHSLCHSSATRPTLPAPHLQAKTALGAELITLCAPIKTVESDRKTNFLNFAKAVHESIPAFQWVFSDNGAGSMLEGAAESSEFWANKVRKDSKEKTQPDWMAWANALRDTHKAIAEFVKENYKQGMTYNGKGAEHPKTTGGAAAPAGAPAPEAPAAAPASAAPAPAPAAAAAATPAAGARPNLAGLFSQIGSIDQSSGKTAGLRHVDKKEVAAAKAAAAPVACVAAPKGECAWGVEVPCLSPAVFG